MIAVRIGKPPTRVVHQRAAQIRSVREQRDRAEHDAERVVAHEAGLQPCGSRGPVSRTSQPTPLTAPSMILASNTRASQPANAAQRAVDEPRDAVVVVVGVAEEPAEEPEPLVERIPVDRLEAAPVERAGDAPSPIRPMTTASTDRPTPAEERRRCDLWCDVREHRLEPLVEQLERWNGRSSSPPTIARPASSTTGHTMRPLPSCGSHGAAPACAAVAVVDRRRGGVDRDACATVVVGALGARRPRPADRVRRLAPLVAVEDEEDLAGHVRAGEDRGDEPDDPQAVVVGLERLLEDAVLRPEARERRHAGDGEERDDEPERGVRHELAEADP